MRKSRFTEEQNVAIVQQAGAGAKISGPTSHVTSSLHLEFCFVGKLSGGLPREPLHPAPVHLSQPPNLPQIR